MSLRLLRTAIELTINFVNARAVIDARIYVYPAAE